MPFDVKHLEVTAPGWCRKLPQEPELVFLPLLLDADCGALLTSADHEELAQISHPLRKAQGVSGKLAKHMAIKRLTARIPYSQCTDLVVRTSVSHSDSLACAAAVLCPPHHFLGIDLQKSAPLDPDLFSVAFQSHEMHLIHREPSAYFLIWSAKEAFYKALSQAELTLVPPSLRDIRADSGEDRSQWILSYGELSQRVICHTWDEYFFAYCYLQLLTKPC